MVLFKNYNGIVGEYQEKNLQRPSMPNILFESQLVLMLVAGATKKAFRVWKTLSQFKELGKADAEGLW